MRVLDRINKDENNGSVPLLAFRRDVVSEIFLQYSKEDKLCSSYAGFKLSHQIFVMIHTELPGAVCEKQSSCDKLLTLLGKM